MYRFLAVQRISQDVVLGPELFLHVFGQFASSQLRLNLFHNLILPAANRCTLLLNNGAVDLFLVLRVAGSAFKSHVLVQVGQLLPLPLDWLAKSKVLVAAKLTSKSVQELHINGFSSSVLREEQRLHRKICKLLEPAAHTRTCCTSLTSC